MQCKEVRLQADNIVIYTGVQSMQGASAAFLPDFSLDGQCLNMSMSSKQLDIVVWRQKALPVLGCMVVPQEVNEDVFRQVIGVTCFPSLQGVG